MQNQSIEHFFSGVDKLTQTYLTQEEVPNVVIMGPYNSGKSTLINNLLGHHLSPVNIIPTTPAPVRFSYGERFLARVYFTDRQMHVLTAGELTGLLTRKEPPGGGITNVEVQYKHELLKKLHIIDTPGIDALHEPSSLLSRLPKCEYIVYLLQQRGLNEADRRYIEKLVRSNKPLNISFWINCNLGVYDGTSLKESRQFLRQICATEVPVYLINTMDNQDIIKIQLFIENQAAIFKLRRITDKLRKLDLQIPGIITDSMRANDDAKFMVQFWAAIEQARLIIQGQNMLKTLTPVSQQIASLMEKTDRPAVDPGGVSIVYKTTGPKRDIVLIREKILSLVEQAINDPSLKPYTDSIRQLESLHGQLKKENYLVTAAGGFSSGKSTFFNALMGEAILPAQNSPTTFTITRLKHGVHKKAIINYARQVVIPTHQMENQQAILCRYELATLEHWISDSKLVEHVYAMEKSKNGRLTKITATELLQQIELLKKSFARVKRDFSSKRRPWKSLFKKVPAQMFLSSELADYFVIHFKDTVRQELNLDTPGDRTTLAKIAGSHLALRVSDIVIEHPAESLRLATFVDTPGLDSVYHHHREITTRYLPLSDCFLFFLNGKHILTQPDMGIVKLIHRAMQKERQPSHKLFIIVNFADTLTVQERNNVYSYLQENLVKPSRGIVDPGNIFFISALDALTGRDRIAFPRIMKHLKEHIWELRCANNYRVFMENFKKAMPVQIDPNSQDANKENQLALLKNEVQTLLVKIKQRMAYWQEQITSFNNQEDFRGFREGQKSIKKGFLGLSRTSVTVPSCQDMSTSINMLLNDFHHKWKTHTSDLTPYEVNTTSLQNTIDHLLENFKLTRAHSILSQYINIQESRIESSINDMERQIKINLKSKAPEPERQNISPTALIIAHQYIAKMNQLEKETFGSIQQ